MSRELARFLATGTLAAAINWFAGIGLVRLVPFEIAIVVAYLIGMLAGFTLYKAFVFPPTDRPLSAQIVGFIEVNLVGIVLVWLVAMGLRAIFPTQLFGLIPGAPVAHGLAIGVSCVTSYIGHRLVTFRPSQVAARVT